MRKRTSESGRRLWRKESREKEVTGLRTGSMVEGDVEVALGFEHPTSEVGGASAVYYVMHLIQAPETLIIYVGKTPL
jgi:hypothetical protein